MNEFVLGCGNQVSVIMDREVLPGVKRVWKKVEEDILQTTGAACVVSEVTVGDDGDLINAGLAGEICDIKSSCTIFIATAEEQELYKWLEKKVSGLEKLSGQWETYGFYVKEDILEGQNQTLVIAGSDLLGTIYGLFHLSELLGVSAAKFWGDAKPVSYSKIVLSTADGSDYIQEEQPGGDVRVVHVENGNSREPSVKYRGFFINDEWPCYGNWTFSHYGGFTAEMYDRVFEYLLRMKGNYLWPAMWTSSFLLDGPGMSSMELADEYGIYIGMSHHEPCMRSSEEWDLVKGEDTPYGTAWDYLSNKDGLLKYWEDGLERARGHNVFPTIGMRGERDSKMLDDDAAIAENVRVLKEIITEQKKLVTKILEEKPDSNETPLMFAVYKEVEDYYFGDGTSAGLCNFPELDGVTLLLCEDNFGNMRALPKAEERQRNGGFGMYFHLDYHGGPVSYEWVNSTPLTKIWEQMTEAYEYGIRDLWIVNVGDVKFQEYPLSYFMELAYDQETWGSKKQDMICEYTKAWVARQFGKAVFEKCGEEIAWVLDETARLNGLRRPEACNDKIYHPAHYREGIEMLEACEKLEKTNEKLLGMLRDSEAYYSIVYYPAAASANLLKMHLLTGKNHLYSAQGKAAANLYGAQLKTCIVRDKRLAQEFAAFKGGKWSGMEKAFHIGFTKWNSEDWRYPVCHTVFLPEEARLIVSRADEEKTFTNEYFPVPLMLEDFQYPGNDEIILQIANGGQKALNWKVEGECEFIDFSCCEGSTEMETEVAVRVKWDVFSKGETKEFDFRVCAGEEFVPVHVKAVFPDYPQLPKATVLGGRDAFVWDADATEHMLDAGEDAGFMRIPDYGKYGSGMKVFPSTASFSGEDAPSLTYDIWVQEAGEYRLMIHTSPANPLVYGGKLNLGVSVNYKQMELAEVTGDTYHGGENECSQWCEAVLNQEHVCETVINCKQGLNKIRIVAQEAGLVLERFVMVKEGIELKASYLGPKKSPLYGSSESFS